MSTILSGGLNKVIGTVGSIIDNVHTSDDERGKLEQAKLLIEVEARRAQDELAAKLEEAYMADLADLRSQVKLEIQSEDPFVRRARPMFLYIMYGVIVFNFMLPAVLAMVGKTVGQIDIPVDLWYIFGGSFLGYAYFRSKDKQVK